MTIEGFALTGTAIFAVGALVAGAVDWYRTNRRYRNWVDGLHIAPTEPMPTEYEQEWLDWGYARDRLRQAEDDAVAQLDEWYGLPVLPDTPTVIRELAAL